jgi:hypothetical protein
VLWAPDEGNKSGEGSMELPLSADSNRGSSTPAVMAGEEGDAAPEGPIGSSLVGFSVDAALRSVIHCSR